MKSNLLPFNVLVGVILALTFLLVAYQVDTPARQTTVLYDAQTGETPNEQGLGFLALGVQAAQSFANNVTTLDTMPRREEQAGYFINETIPLNRTAGYEVQFEIQIQDEYHKSNNRAGFSVIVLSDDLLGIELGFWADEIWAQEGGVDNLFTHAEGTPFNTSSNMSTYRLIIAEDTYILVADDVELLRGPLRDYTAFNEVIDPYETANFLFLGDNTSSASTKVDIAFVALETKLSATATPTPAATNIAAPTPQATPTATATPLPVSALQSTRTRNWWRQCTSGYPPK